MSTCPFLCAREPNINIVSDADDRSVVLVNVYQKHYIRKDALVGSLTYTIGEVLGKLKDGGTQILCITCSTDASSAIKVLEDTLHVGKNTPDGSDLSGITIKFALADEPCGDANADERQAMDAVTRATGGVNPLSSTVVTELQIFETTWGVLLQKMELFNRIVDGVAQVFGVRCLDSFTV